MAEQTPRDDDPIRQLRNTYTERLRIYERRDRIERYVLFAFLWFFFSFWALAPILMLFEVSHLSFLVFAAAATCGLPVTLVVFRYREVLFPEGEPGLLAWWDERRKSR